jgi:phosphopantetheinyl transferase (holo-ACP synthase)
VAVGWLPSAFAAENPDLWDLLLSPAERTRLRSHAASGEPVRARRARSSASDRFLLPLLVQDTAAATSALRTPHSALLTHTDLGQPVVRIDGRPLPGLHVSFTHDGDAHIGVCGFHPELRGIGVDVVHLPRLAGRSAEYLRGFARRFMSEEELVGFETGEGPDLLTRVSAHFSLMEAASKALGTGLRIGGGMGGPESLPKQSLGIRSAATPVEWLTAPDARERMRALGAARLEGHWSAGAEYLVSVALLWEQ